MQNVGEKGGEGEGGIERAHFLDCFELFIVEDEWEVLKLRFIKKAFSLLVLLFL